MCFNLCQKVTKVWRYDIIKKDITSRWGPRIFKMITDIPINNQWIIISISCNQAELYSHWFTYDMIFKILKLLLTIIPNIWTISTVIKLPSILGSLWTRLPDGCYSHPLPEVIWRSLWMWNWCRSNASRENMDGEQK